MEKDFREPKLPKEHCWNFSCSRDGGDGWLLAEMRVRCPDDWFQGILKAPQELGRWGQG